MKSLKFITLLIFLMSAFSAFCQLDQLELQLIDLEMTPAYEKSIEDIVIVDNQIFIITNSNGVYDLIVYDGVEVTEIIKDSDDDLRFYGSLNGGIIVMIG